ncbi:hypothetical protein WR164_00050 [Philodulcilactobacillus myokoensis]|uniref:Integrase n=1 Tax=Philodulcilactobacillus myokoensis TaxID=2929573 RepID=A0A9W6AZJ0_9LACO|nr:integrase domain-containing protein [Philodulcilactobacillus myokoensis]GLB46023.1 hypothetical protein WR164_00020 [Philodulcilactobacillus myokoensis]GLB46026.1 hypothetical protein WR164_00050 [Philodulcilactobacillus myokoensis]
MGRSTIQHELKRELFNQYKNGVNNSRDEDKSREHKFGILNKIYTKQSLKVHLSRVKSFYKWAKSNQIKAYKLNDIKPKMVADYLNYQQKIGRSPWTISADLLMFNHTEVGSGNWNSSLTKKKIKDDYGYKLQRRQSKLITHSRGYTGKSWIQNHKREYERYKDPIDIARAFGLRRDEIIGNHTSHGVRASSFVNNHGKMQVQTIGKGGKYRVANCLGSYNQNMLNKYGNRAISEPLGKDDLKKKWAKEKPLFNANARDVGFHAFRSEYAINRFEELNTGKDNNQININGYVGDKSAFEQVSKDLGHNRLDVLKSYFR